MSALDSSASARLIRLGQLINEPLVQSNLPDGYYEDIAADLETIRLQGADAVSEETLLSLIELVDEYESWLEKFSNQPPAFTAARLGDQAEVERILNAGFDVDSKDADGLTMLMLAASNGNVDIASLLLRRGADIDVECEDQEDIDAMMLACANGHAAIALLLLDKGAATNKRYALDSSQGRIGNQTVLSVAASRGYLNVCRVLINKGADLDVIADSGYTPVMCALVNGASEDAAEMLLDAGANPDPVIQPVEALSENLTSPLILAAMNGLSRIVLKLIGLNVSLDAQDSSGWTALKHACSMGRDDIVKALIDAGADVNLADEEGWTPLIAASSIAAWSTIELLIDAGAEVNATAEFGTCALREVVNRRFLRHSIVLLSKLSGSEVDPEQEEASDIALAFAEKLLLAGAEADVAFDDEGEIKLIDEAKEQGDDALRVLLEKFGAKATSTLEGEEG